jgi:hypothetical protein
MIDHNDGVKLEVTCACSTLSGGFTENSRQVESRLLGCEVPYSAATPEAAFALRLAASLTCTAPSESAPATPPLDLFALSFS